MLSAVIKVRWYPYLWQYHDPMMGNLWSCSVVKWMLTCGITWFNKMITWSLAANLASSWSIWMVKRDNNSTSSSLDMPSGIIRGIAATQVFSKSNFGFLSPLVIIIVCNMCISVLYQWYQVDDNIHGTIIMTITQRQCTHTHAHTNKQTHKLTHTNKHTHIQTNTHTHIYTHILTLWTKKHFLRNQVCIGQSLAHARFKTSHTFFTLI